MANESKVEHKLALAGDDREIAVVSEKQRVEVGCRQICPPLVHMVAHVDPVPEEAGPRTPLAIFNLSWGGL